jgi:hypothetical protein
MTPRALIIANGHPCHNPRPRQEAETSRRVRYDVAVVGGRNSSAGEGDNRVWFRAYDRPASNS